MATATINHQDLHKMIDELPSNKKVVLMEFIKLLHDEDDDPLSEDEIAQIEASRRDIETGNVYTIEEVEEYLREKS